MTSNENQPVNPTASAGNTPTPAQRRARKQFRKRLIWGVILAAIVVGAFLYWRAKEKAASDWQANLQTAKAFKTTLIESVTATGSVNAQTGAQVNIASQLSGVIKRLYADVGSHVVAGQEIAQLDVPDLQAQMEQAQAQLDQAVTKLQQARTTLAQTYATLGQANALLRNARQNQDVAISAAVQQPQQTTSDILKAEAGLDAAKVALVQAQQTRDSQIAAAQAAVTQDQSNVVTNNATLARQKQLFSQGYVAAETVDTAQNQADVAMAQLAAARQNLDVTRTNVNAVIATARAGVKTAAQALAAAKLETLTNQQKQESENAAAATTQQQQQNLVSAKAGIPIQEQNIVVDQQTVTQYQQLVAYDKVILGRGTISTPISGTVISLAEQQGDAVAAGLAAPTLIAVADLNRLQVDAFVDETDIGKVRLGQSASTTVDAFPNQKFAGTVVKVAAGATLQSNVVTYDVTIAIKDPKHQLLPSMTTNSTINVGEHDNVLVVPNEGIKQLKAGKFVYLMPAANAAPDARPTKANVQTGATDGTYTEITSGLEESDSIVLAGWPPASSGAVTMTPFGARAGGGGGGGGGR